MSKPSAPEPPLIKWLVHLHGGAVTALERVEDIMDAMGLLKRRSQIGALDTDRVLKAIEAERAPRGPGEQDG